MVILGGGGVAYERGTYVRDGERGVSGLQLAPVLAHSLCKKSLGSTPTWDLSSGDKPHVGADVRDFTVRTKTTWVPRLQENATPQDPTVGLCLGS